MKTCECKTPDGLIVHDLRGFGLVVLASEHNREIYRLKNPWKSCNESMPELGENVLIACNKTQTIARREWAQGWNSDHWLDINGDRLEMKEVTHWMPLFPLPNVQAQR